MISLYLHIGTEKTGSSHLQSVMALNRELLIGKGYWFPLAGKREQHLMKGMVSPGNAQALTNLIEKENYDKASQLLREHLTVAAAKKCDKVLLSNELLLLALSKDGGVENLQNVAQAAGFSEVHYLLVIRDPVEQALSLYKHRAKNGTAVDIEEWPATHYHYGKGLKGFLQQAKAADLLLTCRKYDRQGNQLDHLFFGDWLGLSPEGLKKPEKRVNPSLSISELLLMRQLRKQNPLLPGLFYNVLIQLPKVAKAKEPRIENYYKATLGNALADYSETWNVCNQFLPKETPIASPLYQAHTPDKVMTFSAEQGAAITQLIHKMQSPLFLARLGFIRYKRRLGRLRNFVLNR